MSLCRIDTELVSLIDRTKQTRKPVVNGRLYVNDRCVVVFLLMTVWTDGSFIKTFSCFQLLFKFLNC